MNEQNNNIDPLEQRALQLWDREALRLETAEWKKEKRVNVEPPSGGA